MGLGRDKAALLAVVESIKTELGELRIELKVKTEEVELQDTINRLKKEVTDLKIDKSRVTETNEREKRELTHMIGLEKKRQEFEVESATTDAILKVKQENLDADKQRFEEQMKFSTQRFEKEVGYLKEIMGEILDRLPNVQVGIDRKSNNESE